jgi:hypothetical protein
VQFHKLVRWGICAGLVVLCVQLEQTGPNAGILTDDLEGQLGVLLRQRQVCVLFRRASSV